MKASYERTPRTLAECEFPVGYPIVDPAAHRYHQGMFVVCVVLICLMIGLWIGFSINAPAL